MKTSFKTVTLALVLVLAVTVSTEDTGKGWIKSIIDTLIGSDDEVAQEVPVARSLGRQHGHVDTSTNGVALISHGFPIVTMCPINVVFILDGSDSVSPQGFDLARIYLKSAIRRVTSMYTDADIGVILFSNGISQQIQLVERTRLQLDSVYDQIDSWVQPRQETDLHLALQTAQTTLRNYNANEGKVVVLISDGCPNNVTQSTNAAREAWENGVYIMSIAIEKAQIDMLKKLSVRIQDIRTPIDWKYTVACPPSTLPNLPSGLDCADIVIVMDGSDSAAKHESVIKQYLANLARRYTSVQNQLGLVVYGTDVNFSISLTSNKLAMSNRILSNELTFPSSGTGTSKGVERALQLLQSSSRQKAIIVITDGPPLDINSVAQQMQKAIRDNIRVVVVGVGNHVRYSNLVQQAGGIESNVITVHSFLDLYSVNYTDNVCGNSPVSCSIECVNGIIVGSGSSCLCQCSRDWSGPKCDIFSKVLCSVCENGGYLIDENNCRCSCPPGYSGNNCEYDLCESINRNCGGTVTRTNRGCTCTCKPGFTGPNCRDLLCGNEYCASPSQGAPTYDINAGRCGCSCRTGYTGPKCELIDCTYNSPCRNGGIPRRSGSSCFCNCPTGWTGNTCETRVVTCQPCLNGGYLSSPNNCVCTCRDGYSGPQCETDECRNLQSTCRNGQLQRLQGGCVCRCNAGLTGPTCDSCAVNNCQNGGQPYVLNGACACRCFGNWAGEFCGRSRDVCFNINCNGGTPSPQGDTCLCLCPDGFTGERCNVRMCTNAATCNSRGVPYFNTTSRTCACNCNSGYLPPFCSRRACSPCQNGGTQVSVTSCGCRCRDGFSGSQCQNDLCSQYRCDQGVKIPTPGGCRCQCNSVAVTGTNCDRCATVCQNGGIASSPATGCRCSCTNGYTGNTCTIPPACLSRAYCNDKGTSRYDARIGGCVCACETGWQGNTCSRRDCSILNCGPGSPILSADQCACSCPAEYTGTRCQTPTCINTQCLNGGTAAAGSGGLCYCRCPSTHSGTRCEIPVCSQCLNGGSRISSTTCGCRCPAGFSGETCQNNLCSQVRCVQGTKIPLAGGCRCQCNSVDISGTNCDQCRNGYCSNGGIATLSTNGCRCNCINGYTGNRCTNPAQCLSPSYCNNHGTSRYDSQIRGCVCTCNAGWQGNQCQTPVCSQCLNGGTRISSTTCGCRCPAGFSGETCQNNLCSQVRCVQGTKIPLAGGCRCQCNSADITGANCDQCRTGYCSNGGIATLSTNGCRCNCINGYTGDRCTRELCSQCLNGGTRISSTTCGCRCPAGFSGETCQNNLCSQVRCVQGTKIPTAGGCRCQCNADITGTNCDQCLNVCQNGGQVFLTSSGCTCTCANGYTGNRCTLPPACATRSYCNNRGTSRYDTRVGGCVCTCDSGWTGNQCQQRDCSGYTQCQNGSPIVLGTNCGCRCNSGWSGSRCDIRDCTGYTLCQNGSPVAQGNNCGCNCRSGWTGTRCESRICTPLTYPCQNGGTTTSNGQTCSCSCPLGYSGPTCGTDMCSGQCGNNGRGEPVVGGGCRCICNADYTGDRCTVSLCEDYCGENGFATTTFSSGCGCRCQSGFTGSRCQSPDCAAIAGCLNGGTGYTEGSGCVCRCTTSWSGTYCQRRVCTQSVVQCQNGGTPTSNGASCSCNCPPGYTGSRCQTEICFGYCGANGTPSFNPLSGCTCTCNAGYTGQKCDTNQCIDYCGIYGRPSLPFNVGCGCICQTDYTGPRCNEQACTQARMGCINGRAQISGSVCACVCNPGFSGPLCDRALCDNYCLNGGNPFPTINGCSCSCPNGFTGDKCQESLCTSYCVNGSPTSSNYPNCGCRCNANYIGEKCDILDPCLSLTCYNGGTKKSQGSFCVCECRPGYTGSDCRTPVCSRSNCNDRGDSFYDPSTGSCSCICNQGYTGRQCESTASCRNDCLNGGVGRMAAPGLCVCDCPAEYTGTVCETFIETKTCTGLENKCQNGQPSIKNACTGQCQCVCNQFYAGAYCEIKIDTNVCDECHWENGIGYTYAKNRCDMYVTCQKLSNGYSTIVRHCAPGTFWDNTDLTCKAVGDVQTCPEDPCRNLQPYGNYSHGSQCQEYYSCGANGVTESTNCCEDGWGFDERSRRCVPNPSCRGTCKKSFDSRAASCYRVGCDFMVNATDNHYFFRKQSDGLTQQKCGPGTIFNESLCTCDYDRTPPSRGAGCNPDRFLHFDNGVFQPEFKYDNVTLSSPSTPISELVGVEGGAGVFDGNDRVLIQRFANSGFAFKYFLIQTRIKPGNIGSEVAVISNGDCGVPESVAITMTYQSIRFTCQPEESGYSNITANYNIGADGWLNLELHYFKNDQGGYTFFAKVNGQKTQEVFLSRPIEKRRCSLQVGHGYGYANFQGYVDWVKVYTTCNPGV